MCCIKVSYLVNKFIARRSLFYDELKTTSNRFKFVVTFFNTGVRRADFCLSLFCVKYLQGRGEVTNSSLKVGYSLKHLPVIPPPKILGVLRPVILMPDLETIDK